jgi:hypothetical protein
MRCGGVKIASKESQLIRAAASRDNSVFDRQE